MVDRPDSTHSEQLDELIHRAHALGERLDEKLHGRFDWTLGAAAASAAGCASVLELRSGAARAAAPFALLTGVCLLWLGFAWLGTCRDSTGALRRTAVRRRLSAELRLLAHDIGEWLRAPKLLKLLIASRVCAAVGFAALTPASLWNLLRIAFSSDASPRWIGLQLLGSAALGLSQLASWARRAHSPRHDPDALDQCQQAALEFPPVVDLSRPLELDTLFIEPTLLHDVVEALARWHPADRWPSTDAYTAALQRHLQKCLPASRVERGCWLGDTRAAGVADLVVDDTVLLEVQRGFSTRRADAALTHVRACAQSGRGKPIILAVFDATSGDLLQGSAGSSLTDLHEQGAFVAACMPGARKHSERPAEGPRPSSIPPSLG